LNDAIQEKWRSRSKPLSLRPDYRTGYNEFSSMRTGKQFRVRGLFLVRRAAEPTAGISKRIPKTTEGL